MLLLSTLMLALCFLVAAIAALNYRKRLNKTTESLKLLLGDTKFEDGTMENLYYKIRVCQSEIKRLTDRVGVELNTIRKMEKENKELIDLIYELRKELESTKHELMKKDHLCDILNRFLEKAKENVTLFGDQNRFLNRDKCTLERLLEESRVEIENLKTKIPPQPTNGE